MGGHEPRNAIQAGRFTVVDQILVHARCANHTTAVLVNLPNTSQ